MSRRSSRIAELSNALRHSPFRHLAENDLLGLVLGRTDVLEHDSLCAALVCCAFRDAIFERCQRPLGGGSRLTTRACSLGLSVGRLAVII